MASNIKRILLVDDEKGRSSELTSIFTELNYEVVAFRSASEALGKIKSLDIDTVVTSADGGSKGYDLCKSLRDASRTKQIPIVLLSGASDADSQFARHQKSASVANGYIKLPAPSEDIIDWVERLIGLPPPPPLNGHAAPDIHIPMLGGGDEELEKENATLRREQDELREQIHFLEQQLAHVSVAGEKESREMDQVLNDLQKDLEKARKEKDQLRDELQLSKGDLTRKDREIRDRESKIAEAKEEGEEERSNLRKEIEELRATFEESEEKHKRAQNALREYYKPKLASMAKMEKTVSVLEDELVKLSGDIKSHKDRATEAEKESRKAKEELETEKKKSEKIREALASTARLLEE